MPDLSHTREIVIDPPPFRLSGVTGNGGKTWGVRVRFDTKRGPVDMTVSVDLPEALQFFAKEVYSMLTQRLAAVVMSKQAAKGDDSGSGYYDYWGRWHEYRRSRRGRRHRAHGTDSAGFNPFKRIRRLARAVKMAALQQANKALRVLPGPVRAAIEKPLQMVASATNPAAYHAALKSAINKLGTTSIPGTNIKLSSLSTFATAPLAAAKLLAKTTSSIPGFSALKYANPLAAASAVAARLGVPGADMLQAMDPLRAAGMLAGKMGIPGAELASSLAAIRQGDASAVPGAIEQASELAQNGPGQIESMISDAVSGIVGEVAADPRQMHKIAAHYLMHKASTRAQDMATDPKVAARCGAAIIRVPAKDKSLAVSLTAMLRGVGRGDKGAVSKLDALAKLAKQGNAEARRAWVMASHISHAALKRPMPKYNTAGDGSGTGFGVPGYLPPPSPTAGLLTALGIAASVNVKTRKNEGKLNAELQSKQDSGHGSLLVAHWRGFAHRQPEQRVSGSCRPVRRGFLPHGRRGCPHLRRHDRRGSGGKVPNPLRGGWHRCCGQQQPHHVHGRPSTDECASASGNSGLPDSERRRSEQPR